MRLPDEVRKSVVFLGHREESHGQRKFKPEGTAFLVSVPSSEIAGFEMTFLVTAKHIARNLEPDFEIRFNTKDGYAEYVEVYGRNWFYHQTDESVDAAVMPWGPPLNADCLWIPHRMFLDASRMQEKGIGVGDEVFATGLFSPMIGLARNTPIVRTGHLTMSPPERIPLKDWVAKDIEAYLIETRSLGGLSGSPVFVQRSIKVHAAEETGRQPVAAGAIFLLGLMHGHWNVQHLDLDYVSPKSNDKKEDLLNVGIAMVPPAYRITEILQRDDLQKLLHDAEHEAVREHPNYLDGGSPSALSVGSTEPLRVAVSASESWALSKGFGSVEDRLGTVEQEPPTKDENP